MNFDFAGKVAVVTGGGKGIGRAIAVEFARAGATSVLAARTESALDETAATIHGFGGKALCVPTDLCDSAAVTRLFERTKQELGRLDVLVNNSGIEGPTAPVTEITDEQWDQVMNVNVRGVFLCCRAAVPMLKESRGCIINLSSLGGGLRAYPNRLPYATSKAADVAIARSLGVELAAFGIRVNAICPGPVAGDRFESVVRNRARVQKKTPEAVREWIIDQSPLHHVTDPREVAECALWLASDAAKSVTAQHINLTCGVEWAP